MESVTFGARLQAARKAKGLSIQDLVAKTGVSRDSFERWEGDKGSPQDPAILVSVAQLLDTTVEALCGKTPLRSAQEEAWRQGRVDAATEMQKFAARIAGRAPTLPRRGATPESDQGQRGA